MATYDLQEQEQIEELKAWWKTHGTLITALVALLAIGVVAWQGWQWWQRTQAAQAAQLYGNLQQALQQQGEQNAKRVRLIAGELIDNYPHTSYAAMAVLLSGKLLFETGDLKSAEAHYAWAAEHATDQGTRDLARLRQALVLVEEKHFDAALKRLAVPPAPSFMARYLEVRGDILVAQGRGGEARTAYDEALKALEDSRKAEGLPSGPYLEILQAKRDAAGVQS